MGLRYAATFVVWLVSGLFIYCFLHGGEGGSTRDVEGIVKW